MLFIISYNRKSNCIFLKTNWKLKFLDILILNLCPKNVNGINTGKAGKEFKPK